MLWDVLEAVYGAPLDDDVVREMVSEPLGMTDTVFRPTDLGLSDCCPPTEWCHWRDRLLQGEVHDENCAQLGGATPHAGLFSTAVDLGRLMTEHLRALAGSSAWLDRASAATLVTRRGARASTFAVGWATPINVDGERGDPLVQPWRIAGAGSVLSDRSFGHTGFTGPSVVADPDRGIWIVVLANRVHPSRSVEGMPKSSRGCR